MGRNQEIRVPEQVITREMRFRPEQAGGYALLPFELPEHTVRLEVQYAYNHRIGAEPEYQGGNTLDLGLFDERGSDFLKAGCRGWSGSERDGFYITGREATPGYLAGALNPGRWQVMLGLYKLAPEGCTAQVSITITTGQQDPVLPADPAPVTELPSSAVKPRFALWLCGDLHCHTWHSDGDLSPTELIALARRRGLDFLAVTDHNTTSSQRELAQFTDPGLILLRGLEVTSFRGHFNAWGASEWIDFRIEGPQMMADAVQYAKDHAALTACNHPRPGGPPWEYPQVSNYDCIEVWNGPWEDHNQIALDFWLSQLADGRRIPAVGGSDFHHHGYDGQEPERILGNPTLWAYVTSTPNEASILQAVRSGHAALSESPQGPLLELRAGATLQALGGDSLPRPQDQVSVQLRCRQAAGHWLRLLDQQGALFERKLRLDDETVATSLPVGASLYLRAELRAADGGMKALANPIYFG
jgi:hypothetical protein